MLKALQVLDVLKIFNLVFSEVKFCEFAAVLEVAQGLDFVETQTANFDVGHVFERGDVFQLAAPEVEILYLAQLVALAFLQHEIW